MEIQKITPHEAQILSEIAVKTFIASHGSSASDLDIKAYIAEKYTVEQFENELTNPSNLYYFIHFNNEIAGFSKLVLDVPFNDQCESNFAKLERLYLLEEFYDKKLGQVLFQFNCDLAKQHFQKGIWLFVWTGNQRAIRFYDKSGFKIIGSHNFKISDNHYNPNHQMLLQF
jgi:ribosomal protein S18 acetylase RimI-like enzyme